MTTARVNGTEVSEHSENPEERLEGRPVVVLSKNFRRGRRQFRNS
jgi:hypothetical protein